VSRKNLELLYAVCTQQFKIFSASLLTSTLVLWFSLTVGTMAALLFRALHCILHGKHFSASQLFLLLVVCWQIEIVSLSSGRYLEPTAVRSCSKSVRCNLRNVPQPKFNIATKVQKTKCAKSIINFPPFFLLPSFPPLPFSCFPIPFPLLFFSQSPEVW